MRNGVISLLSVLVRESTGSREIRGLNEALITPMLLLPSPLGLKRGAEKPPGRPQPLIQCAHMVGSSKEENSSRPGAVRTLELSSCSLLRYITSRMQRGWKE